MTDATPFNPDWCVHPGATLQDWMDEMKLSPRVVAGLMKLEVADVEDLVAGKMELDEDVARRLWNATQIPTAFWLKREQHFRTALAEGKIWSGKPT